MNEPNWKELAEKAEAVITQLDNLLTGLVDKAVRERVNQQNVALRKACEMAVDPLIKCRSVAANNALNQIQWALGL